MIIEPNSNIRIIKSPIELDSLNQLTFSTKQAQENYFKSLPYLEIDDSSYQRKDGYIRFPASFDEAIKYNYCMYQNENYSNKWFYAYITNVEYLNDDVTALYLETDVFQTWQFDIIWRESFIEREMLSSANDTIGANTQPENLETGDYVTCKESVYFENDPRNYYICMGVSDVPFSDISFTQNNRMYNGVYSGLYYLVFNNSDECSKMISLYDKGGRKDAIFSIFMITDIVGISDTGTTWTHDGISATFHSIINSSFDDDIGVLNASLPIKLGKSYIPKNKKLFTFPYSFCTLSNSSGNVKPYHYEDFLWEGGIEIEFNIVGCITPSMSIKAIPKYYKNHTEYYDEGLVAGKLPVCSWISDSYVNWLTQNSLNNSIALAGSAIQLIGGAALAFSGAGALAGASQITSGIFGIANILGERYQHSLVPDQVQGNANSGDINFSALNCGMFTLNYLSIKDEYARVIDNYFSMFGYRTNLVKLPNLNNRSKWNYVKTINANIIGDIPQKDLQKIKELFNNGITLWHDSNTFLDYSQTNS